MDHRHAKLAQHRKEGSLLIVNTNFTNTLGIQVLYECEESSLDN